MGGVGRTVAKHHNCLREHTLVFSSYFAPDMNTGCSHAYLFHTHATHRSSPQFVGRGRGMLLRVALRAASLFTALRRLHRRRRSWRPLRRRHRRRRHPCTGRRVLAAGSRVGRVFPVVAVEPRGATTSASQRAAHQPREEEVRVVMLHTPWKTPPTYQLVC